MRDLHSFCKMQKWLIVHSSHASNKFFSFKIPSPCVGNILRGSRCTHRGNYVKIQTLAALFSPLLCNRERFIQDRAFKANLAHVLYMVMLTAWSCSLHGHVHCMIMFGACSLLCHGRSAPERRVWLCGGREGRILMAFLAVVVAYI